MTVGGNYTSIDIPFQGQSCLRCDLQDDAKPIDFFNLYFTDAVIQKISDETTMYAHQFLETEGPNLKPYSIAHGWKDTNLKRLELFLEFVSLWVIYTNQEFGCTGLLILCTTLPFWTAYDKN